MPPSAGQDAPALQRRHQRQLCRCKHRRRHGKGSMESSTVSTSAPLSVRERQSRMQPRQKAWAQSSRPNFLADGSGFDSTCAGSTLLTLLCANTAKSAWASCTGEPNTTH